MLKTHRIEDRQFDSFLALCGDEQGLLDSEADLHGKEWNVLLEHRNALNRARSTLRSDASGRALSDDERGALAAIRELVADVQAEIDVRDELNDRSPRASSSRGRKTSPDAGDSPNRPLARAGADGSFNLPASPHGAIPTIDAAIPGRGRFEHVFGQAQSTGGFKSLGEFVRAVATKDSQRLMAAAGMNEAIGQDGGWLVPPMFTSALMNAAYEQEIIRPRCRVLPLLSKTLEAPMFSWTDRTKGPGALIGYWSNEGTELTKQKPKVTSLTFTARKLSILVPLTNELLYDAAPQSDAYLREAMSSTIAAYMDRAFFGGSGVGQPLGFIGSAARVTVSKEAAQVAATINFENVSKMVSRLLPASFSRSVWLAHPATLPQLMQLKIRITNVAGSENVGGTVAPIQIDAAGNMTLMTRPVILTDICSDLGAEGDLVLCDLSGYAVAMQPDIRFAVSSDVGFTSDETYFRLIARCDGQTILNSTVTPKNGSNALSHFVTLETRS